MGFMGGSDFYDGKIHFIVYLEQKLITTRKCYAITVKRPEMPKNDCYFTTIVQQCIQAVQKLSRVAV